MSSALTGIVPCPELSYLWTELRMGVRNKPYINHHVAQDIVSYTLPLAAGTLLF